MVNLGRRGCTIKTIKLTAKELRALESILWATNPCESGCAYPEMEKSKRDCIDCELPKSISSIMNKLEKPVNK